MTAPTPSSPDPDHSRRSARPYQGRDGRARGGGWPGSHRRGDPSGADRPASSYGAYEGPGAYDGSHGYENSGGYANHGAYESSGAYESPGGHGAYGPAHPEDLDDGRPDVRREVRDGALCALIMAVLGVGLGAMWLWLAPRVPLVNVHGSVFLKDPEGEEAIGADGTFVLLALGFGLVTGTLAFLRSRSGGIGIVIGLVVGALLGSALGWQFGAWLGPGSDLAASAKAAGENKPFDGPLKLQAKGALLAWPFFALMVHLALMGVFGRRDPEPGEQLPPGSGGARPNW